MRMRWRVRWSSSAWPPDRPARTGVLPALPILGALAVLVSSSMLGRRLSVGTDSVMPEHADPAARPLAVPAPRGHLYPDPGPNWHERPTKKAPTPRFRRSGAYPDGGRYWV